MPKSIDLALSAIGDPPLDRIGTVPRLPNVDDLSLGGVVPLNFRRPTAPCDAPLATMRVQPA
jgi:hypothetical protein